MTTTERKKLTEPLESVTIFLGTLAALFLAVVAWLALFAPGGDRGYLSGSLCLTQPDASYAASNWTTPLATPLHGADISIHGAVQVCAAHPAAVQWLLYAMTLLPTALFWTGVLVLLWRVLRAAHRRGPFAPRVAQIMRQLGWFVMVGSLAAALIRTSATDILLSGMVRAPALYADLLVAPVSAVLPVPLLAGAGLISFARIVRAGSAMEEEIKATI